jgi:hypothetical protein
LLSTIVLIILTFALLGLLLGFAASFDIPRAKNASIPANTDSRDPGIQSKLFEDCIKEAELDGLTEDEYFRCAYDIYD